MTLRDVFMTFAHTSTASAGLVLVYGLITIKHQKSIFRLLLLLVLISFAADITSIVFSRTGFSSTWPISNSYHFLQYWIISAIYYTLIPNRKFRVLVYVLLIVFSGCYLFLISDIEKFKTLLSLPRTISSVSFIVYSIVYYYTIITAKELRSLKGNKEFYLNSTFFLFFSSIFIIYLVSEYLRSSPYKSYHPYLWMVHNTFSIAKNCMFGLIFFLNTKK